MSQVWQTVRQKKQCWMTVDVSAYSEEICEQINFVVPNVFIGSSKGAKNKDLLKLINITFILNCAHEHQNYYNKSFKYYNLPLHDSHLNRSILKSFDKGADFIHRCVNKNRRVFIHCHKGISRSTAILCAYLIKYQRRTPDASLTLIKSAREKVKPNTFFQYYLEKYYNQLYVK